MTRLSPRTRWALVTYGPAWLAVVITAIHALDRDWHSAMLWVLWSGTAWAMGNTTLSSYRAGYWRGRYEEGTEETPEPMRKLLTGWQPGPWDDGRW
jgi:hypothetical protein